MEKFIHSFQHPFVKRDKFHKNGSPFTPEFDFVVVGGGPAGCALATRLFEDGAFSVLLIEQGTSVEQHPELRNCVNHILQTRSLHGSAFDYQYPTVSEGQFSSQELKISSGKVLGGSTCINFAIWTRGAKADYDLWAEIAGNDELRWDNMVPCFEKVEGSKGNSTGPISVRHISSTKRNHYWSTTAASSFEQTGFKKLDDINGGNVLGYAEMVESIDERGRCSAGRYFENIKPKEAGGATFEVWTSLRVQKVAFGETEGEEGPKAVGVVTQFGFIRAKREVILTAGAVQSPHLLLLSGVGPATHLAEHGIPVVIDSPQVGQNLWEHPFVDIRFKLRPDKRKDTVETFASLLTSAEHVNRWAKTKSGLMTGLLYEWMAFTNMRKEVEDSLKASTLTPTDRHVLLRSSTPHIEQFIHYGHGLKPAPDALQSSYIAITNVLLTPRSRGSITLSTKDSPAAESAKPDTSLLSNNSGFINANDGTSVSLNIDDTVISTTAPVPRIVVNQMKELMDQEIMIKALEKAYEILRAPAWKEYLEHQETPTREELLEIIKDRVTTLWHLGGTCSMQTSDAPGVVDSTFRVLGVRNLRIADISVVPFPVAAHTQSVAYALGEKMADLIKREYTPA